MKNIDFACPECQAKMTLPANVKGRKVRCPKCHTKSVAKEGGGVRINGQAFVLVGALLAIVAFCVAMSFLSGSTEPNPSPPPESAPQ